MEWQLTLLLIFGCLVILFLIGLPIAFSFLLITMVGAIWVWGGEKGLQLLVLNIRASISSFTLLPLPMFILMGEMMSRSGLGEGVIDAVDKLLGRIPGRLSLLAVISGTLLSVLSGVTIATTAVLGSTLVPKMVDRGYKKEMVLGPILGSGGLAMMIPPSSLAILYASVAQVSVAQLLVSTIIPAILMAALYGIYIIGRVLFQPHLAPPYDAPASPLSVKLIYLLRYVLPCGLIIFLVIGLIMLGIASPTESAATGALGSIVIAYMNRQLSWEVLRKVVLGTVHITVMLFMIIAGAVTFSQILTFTGVTQGLVGFVAALPLEPIFIIISMQIAILFMGCFLDPGSIIMISIPLFIPITVSLEINPIWFGALFLLNIEMGMTTPPFGLGLFTMKGVAPPDVTIEDCYKAAFPFLVCDLVVMVLMFLFPQVNLWLPSLMMR